MATLRELRAAAGLTQARLAEAAGVSLSTIQKLEQGDTLPDWITLQGLRGALGDAVFDLEFQVGGRHKRGRKPKEEAQL